jgi:hypothetical protein
VETGLGQGYLGTARRKGRQQTNQTYCYRATSLLYRFIPTLPKDPNLSEIALCAFFTPIEICYQDLCQQRIF